MPRRSGGRLLKYEVEELYRLVVAGAGPQEIRERFELSELGDARRWVEKVHGGWAPGAKPASTEPCARCMRNPRAKLRTICSKCIDAETRARRACRRETTEGTRPFRLERRRVPPPNLARGVSIAMVTGAGRNVMTR